jgi:thiol-disulfide isomerase/thioredoxin
MIDIINTKPYNTSMNELKEYLNKGNNVQELSEKAILDLIDSGAAIVLKVWMNNCSFCKKYAPIFEKAANNNKDKNLVFAAFNLPAKIMESEFADKFMKENGSIKGSAPATMLFSNGQLSARHYGLITQEQLDNFVATGEPPVNKKQLAQQELTNLFTEKGAIITAYEALPKINERIAELQMQLAKG